MAPGAAPFPIKHDTFFVFASKYNAKASPPIPVEYGSTTFKVAATATAASAAFPPYYKILTPTELP